MKHMEKATVLRLLGLLILVSLLLGSMGQTLVLGAQPEPLVLARVEVTDGVDALGLPVYAHLQDAAGNEYALVITPVSQLDQAGVDYRILDTEASGSAYVVALERRPGARQQAAQVVAVLLDDGLHIVARATLEQAEALAELGFDIQRLDDTPMVLGAPARLAAEAMAAEYDPTIALICKFDNGAIGRVSTSLECNMPYVFHLQVNGSKGCIRNNGIYSTSVFPGATGFMSIPATYPDDWNVSHHPFPEEVAYFIDCVAGDVESHVSIRRASKTYELTFAAELAAAEGRVVKLPVL